jgi:hypothetical protein
MKSQVAQFPVKTFRDRRGTLRVYVGQLLGNLDTFELIVVDEDPKYRENPKPDRHALLLPPAGHALA